MPFLSDCFRNFDLIGQINMIVKNHYRNDNMWAALYSGSRPLIWRAEWPSNSCSILACVILLNIESLAMISAMGGCILIYILSSLQSSLSCGRWLIQKKNHFPIRQTVAACPIYFTPDYSAHKTGHSHFLEQRLLAVVDKAPSVTVSLKHTHTHLFWKCVSLYPP